MSTELTFLILSPPSILQCARYIGRCFKRDQGESELPLCFRSIRDSVESGGDSGGGGGGFYKKIMSSIDVNCVIYMPNYNREENDFVKKFRETLIKSATEYHTGKRKPPRVSVSLIVESDNEKGYKEEKIYETSTTNNEGKKVNFFLVTSEKCLAFNFSECSSSSSSSSSVLKYLVRLNWNQYISPSTLYQIITTEDSDTPFAPIFVVEPRKKFFITDNTLSQVIQETFVKNYYNWPSTIRETTSLILNPWVILVEQLPSSPHKEDVADVETASQSALVNSLIKKNNHSPHYYVPFKKRGSEEEGEKHVSSSCLSRIIWVFFALFNYTCCWGTLGRKSGSGCINNYWEQEDDFALWWECSDDHLVCYHEGGENKIQLIGWWSGEFQRAGCGTWSLAWSVLWRLLFILYACAFFLNIVLLKTTTDQGVGVTTPPIKGFVVLYIAWTIIRSILSVYILFKDPVNKPNNTMKSLPVYWPQRGRTRTERNRAYYGGATKKIEHNATFFNHSRFSNYFMSINNFFGRILLEGIVLWILFLTRIFHPGHKK